jgi:hypothetical protein
VLIGAKVVPASEFDYLVSAEQLEKHSSPADFLLHISVMLLDEMLQRK